MRKLLLLFPLLFLITNCKKEKLLSELSFLEGEWKLVSTYNYVNSDFLNSSEKSLILKFTPDGKVFYTNSKGSLEFRIVVQDIEMSNIAFLDLYNFTSYKRLKLKLKDKKQKAYFVYFYFQNDDNSKIFGTYYLPDVPISSTNIDIVESIDITNENEVYETLYSLVNPYCGIFLKN